MMRDPYEDVAPRYGVVKRGKLVTFYKNGDPHFKGLTTSVSGKHFVAMHTLLSWLNDKIDTVNGVKHIFALPDGREIDQVTRFEAGCSYVVSSVRPFVSIPYGTPRHRFPRNDDSLPHASPQSHTSVQPHASLKSRFRHKVHVEADDASSASDEVYLPLQQKQQTGSRNLDQRGRSDQKFSDLLEAEKCRSSPRSRSWGSPTRSTNAAAGQQQQRQQQQLSQQDSIDIPMSSKSSIIDEMRQQLSRQDKLDSARFSVRSSTSEIKNGAVERQTSVPADDWSQQQQDQHQRSKRDSLYGGMSDSGTERFMQEHRKSRHEAENKSQSAPLDQLNKHHNIWSPISFQDDYYPKAKPRLLLIISNTDRSSRQRVIFNPRTLQSFEEVLTDIARIVHVAQPPVTALYSARPPYVKVLGISHLSRALKNCDELLACGTEMIPIEMQSFSYFQSRMHNHNPDPAVGIRSSKSLDYITSGTALMPEETSRKRKKDRYITREELEDKTKNLSLQCGCKDCECNVHKTFSRMIITESLSSTKR